MSLAGCRIVVTGASSGLGAHAVRHLVGLGAHVLAAARRVDRLERLAADLAGSPGRIVVPGPTSPSTPTRGRWSPPPSRHSAASTSSSTTRGARSRAPIDVLADADFEGMLRANVISVFICTRAALEELRKSRGVVVNLGSTVVTRPPRGRFGYVASKGAVEAMSRALALDLGRDGIRVNVLRPGIIPSELRGLTEEEERAKFATGIAFGKQALSAVGDPRDIAEAIAWLAGPGGRFVTGAVIDVDGGYVLGAADVLP